MSILLSKVMTIVVIGAFYFAGVKLTGLLMPFILGWLVSLVIDPLVRLFTKLHISRGIASIISLLLFITIGAIVISGIATLIFTEVKDFGTNNGSFTEFIDQTLIHIDTTIDKIVGNTRPQFASMLKSAISNLINSLSKYIGTAVSKVISIFSAIQSTLLSTVFFILSAFFFTKDRDKHIELYHRLLPDSIKNNRKLYVLKTEVFGAIWGYIKSQLILTGITFVESAIGLFFLGFSYSIFISLIVAVIDIVPVLGAGAVYVPWIIYNVIMGRYKEAVVLLILYLIITIGRQLLQPKILSSQIGLSPLLTLISIYLGLKIFGFLGIIIGPLIVIITIAIVQSEVPTNNNYP